tara:strand:- start:166 stop:831 length:666 start_codon:yes stop_codon:yes gene_type:complete
MNLLQASILGHINDNTKLSALQLAECLNAQLKDINMEINSLIYSKIITRDSKYKSDDIEIIFFVNPDFKSENTDINLIDIIDTIAHNQKQVLTDDNIYLHSLIKVMITDIINDENNKMIERNSLYENLIKNMINHNNNKVKNTVITYSIYEQIILEMLCSNIIIKIDNNYSIGTCDSDFDLDSFDITDTKQDIDIRSNIALHDDNIEFSDITDSDDEPESV